MSNTFTLWQSAVSTPIAVRIAIAGDFLPAGLPMLPTGSEWRGRTQDVAEIFEDVEISAVNLEACLSVGDLAPRSLTGLGQIVSAPAESLEYLKLIRCHAVGIANNHAYDYGHEGVARTKAAINRYNMVSLGAGIALQDGPETFVWRGPDTLRAGFWAAAEVTSNAAKKSRPGVEPANLRRAKHALKEMKKRGATFCVALLHAGCMRTNRPDPEDVKLMEQIAESGFDLVGASHSHRIAGYKHLGSPHNRDAFCFFGLGSIVSGYASSPLEQEGLVVVAGLSSGGKLVSVEIRPVVIDRTGFGIIPSGEQCVTILDRFHGLSSEIRDGSYEKHFYREISQGLGRLYFRDARAAFRSGGIPGLVRKAGRVRLRHMKRMLHKVAG
jgi:poly-gamma-glutamate capsule biosynthesis protein CapA/YwtB (metallophosphatase superfamily)